MILISFYFFFFFYHFSWFTNKLSSLAVGRREGIHESVAKDVTSIFKGKTVSQLEALQSQIQEKITGKPEGVDVGYWESLSSQLNGNDTIHVCYKLNQKLQIRNIHAIYIKYLTCSSYRESAT